ncbi:MAG: DegT/DnrJ/EryC1/StrS aminotransferase family protein [Leptospiraceae bacterium]
MQRSNKLPFARPDLTDLEFEAVKRVMESGWITSGPETDAFETEFAEFIGAPAAAALNSATAALHLGLVALGIGPGDVVLVPALTFTATAEVVSRTGARPVLLDVDREDYLLSPAIVQKFLDSCKLTTEGPVCDEGRIRAIICVHYGGRVCDLDGLFEICEKMGLELLQDAAHSFPSRDGSGFVGRRGPVTAFSFYATKNMTTGEGGMLTGDRPEIIERVQQMRLHGIATPAHRRAGWHYDVVEQGYKYNLSDIASAIGRVQIKRSMQMWERRKAIHERYQAAFAEIPDIRVCPEQVGSAFHLYTLEIEPEAAMDRDRFISALDEKKIGTGLHFIPLYRMTYYKERYNLKEETFPSCEEIFARIVSLPIYSAMSDQDCEDVIQAVRSSLGRS